MDGDSEAVQAATQPQVRKTSRLMYLKDQVVPPVVSADFVEMAKVLECLNFLESERILQQLENQRLISEGEVDAIKFHGLGLKTIEETAAWVEMNSPNGNFDFSLIPDVYFIYELLYPGKVKQVKPKC